MPNPDCVSVASMFILVPVYITLEFCVPLVRYSEPVLKRPSTG
jgi:hypothetical protein